MKCDLTRLENTTDLSRLKTDLDKKSMLSQVNGAMALQISIDSVCAGSCLFHFDSFSGS